jgi:hypothetical protein
MKVLIVVYFTLFVVACGSLRSSYSRFRLPSSSAHKFPMTPGSSSTLSSSAKRIQRRGLAIGNGMSIVDVYACHPDTMGLVTTSIDSWMQASLADLEEICTHSVVFTSTDGKRVVHYTGLREMSKDDAESIFSEYKSRTNGKDGTPAALRESTHLYTCTFSAPLHSILDFSSPTAESYKQIYSIDVYTCKLRDYADAVRRVRSSSCRYSPTHIHSPPPYPI